MSIHLNVELGEQSTVSLGIFFSVTGRTLHVLFTRVLLPRRPENDAFGHHHATATFLHHIHT